MIRSTALHLHVSNSLLTCSNLSLVLNCGISYTHNAIILHVLLVEKYDHLVNGEAQQEIDDYMAEEHDFEHYCEVCEVPNSITLNSNK